MVFRSRGHEMGNGKLEVGNEKWEMGNGKRELGDCRRVQLSSLSFALH